MGGLTQEFARLKIENAFVGGAAIAANEHAPARQTVFHRDVEQLVVSGLKRRVENDPHVRHDVDEQRLRSDERAQVLAFVLEPQRQRTPGLDHHVIEPRLAGEFVPAVIGGQENKTQVMNIAVHFAGFERSAVAFGLLPPLRVARTAMEDPHHAGKEAVAPVRPGFAVVPPAPLLGVHGVEVGVAFDESSHLVLREIKGLFKGWLPVGRRAEFDHESTEFSRIGRDRQC